MKNEQFLEKFQAIKNNEILTQTKRQFSTLLGLIQLKDPRVKGDKAEIDKAWETYVFLYVVLIRKIGLDLNKSLLTESQSELVDNFIEEMKIKVTIDKQVVNRKIEVRVNFLSFPVLTYPLGSILNQEELFPDIRDFDIGDCYKEVEELLLDSETNTMQFT